MAELHVRNLPPEVYLWLRQRARAQGRSMSAEAVAILRAALHDARPVAGRDQAIDQLRAIRQRSHLDPDALLPRYWSAKIGSNPGEPVSGH